MWLELMMNSKDALAPSVRIHVDKLRWLLAIFASRRRNLPGRERVLKMCWPVVSQKSPSSETNVVIQS